jgi:DNA-binding SARP family transcriptional activator
MIQIRTLGSLAISRDGTAFSGAATHPRRMAVLALVARAGSRGITRDRLISLLWPDSDEQASRASLSQVLHALRRQFGDEEVFLGVQTLTLNEAVASCDVVEFETALDDGNWERAVAAYGGPFLDGFRISGLPEMDRWIDEERSQLALRYADAVERLARNAVERGNAHDAVKWWRRRASTDPLNARVTVELM